MTGLTDLYAVLGVAPDCEDFVIQAAYRASMRRYHPDTNKDPAAEQKAQAINAAYAVLGDPERRARYDSARRKSTDGQSTSNRKSQNRAEPESPPPPPPPMDNSEVVPFEEGRGGMAAFAFLLVLGAAAIIAYASTPNIERQADELREQADSLDTMNVDETLTTNEVLANEVASATLSEIPQPTVEYSNVEAAANRLASILMKDGIAGARSYSQNCHKDVQESPSWEGADNCAAFDFAAAYVDQAISGEGKWAPSGYFKFQQDNMDDTYEAAGAPPYTVAARLNQIRRAVEPAAAEALQVAIAKQRADEARAAREAPPAPAPADPFANESASDSTYVGADGGTRND